MKIIFNSTSILNSKERQETFPEKTDIGFLLKTPCDITFYQENGIPKVKLESGYKRFVEPRPPMDGFKTPYGYSDNHFHWNINWGPELPKGYSALYIPPLNNFSLPFITTSGIIDNDKLTTTGRLPFFIKKNFEGTIKRGTEYINIIPFKREDWEAEYNYDIRHI